MKKLGTVLCLTMTAALLFTGCKANDSTTQPPVNTEANQETQAPALDVDAAGFLNMIWDNFPADKKFPAMGGGMENMVDDAAANLDLTKDADMLTYTLFVPESLNGKYTEAASLMHSMNSNIFTGVSFKVAQADQADFIATLQDAISNAHFMCGFPEKLAIVSAGDCVAYAFGDTDLITDFEESATNNIEGAKVEVSQPLE